METISTRERKPSMSGFLIDGFGAGETTSVLSNVGYHHCKYCYSDQDFVLSEIKLKLKALFIPIASVKTKYAVVCSICGNGYYVDETQRDAILYDGAKAEVKDDRLIITVPDSHRSYEPSENSRYVCPRCGKSQPEAGNFCVHCGAPMSGG